LDNDIAVHDGPPHNDTYIFNSEYPTALPVAGLDILNFHIALIDTDATGFMSDALPLTPLDLSEFSDQMSGVIFYDDPLNRGMNFQVTSLTLVPEPTTLALAMIGLLCIACRRRKRVCGLSKESP
jgi:hypothetical protein